MTSASTEPAVEGQEKTMSDEQKHTPGPWEAIHFSKLDGGPIETVDDVVETLAHIARQSEKTELHAVAVDPDGECLVVAVTGNGPTSAANARLIEAAPELLEALRSALFWLEKLEEDRDEAAFQMFCNWARQTISRAEGGDES